MERVGIRQRLLWTRGLRPAIWRRSAKKALASGESRPPISMPLSWGRLRPTCFFPRPLVGASISSARECLGSMFRGLLGRRLSSAPAGAQSCRSGAHKKVLVFRGGCECRRSSTTPTARPSVIFAMEAGAVLLTSRKTILADRLYYEVDGAGGCSPVHAGGGSLNPSTHETVDKDALCPSDGAAVFKFACERGAALRRDSQSATTSRAAKSTPSFRTRRTSASSPQRPTV